MQKRKAESDDRCPACTAADNQLTRPPTIDAQQAVDWIACEHCETWYHCACLSLQLATVERYYCTACQAAGHGTTILREARPRRARAGVDYNALDAGEHVNALRHKYTTLVQERAFATATVRALAEGHLLTKASLDQFGFEEPIVIRNQAGLGMSIQADLTVDEVARRVGRDKPLEVMDVPTQGEDTGWTLGRWADYYKEPNPTRVRNVISLELSDSTLGQEMRRPQIVRDLDVIDRFWDVEEFDKGAFPKVRLYCLMSLTNSYTDFHVDFAGTSVFYHILAGQKTFLFIRPTAANLKKYSDWCLSSNQASTFLADACKDTFKVDLQQGDTLMIPSGWIHAVHTPAKSLVIGGNFLSVLGLARHLDIVAIEERTKVPGKFRFPQLARALWFTALGVLQAPEQVASETEWHGLCKLVSYLDKQARAISGESVEGVHLATAKRDYPATHVRGDAQTVVAVFARCLEQLGEERAYTGQIAPELLQMHDGSVAIRITTRTDKPGTYHKRWVTVLQDGSIKYEGKNKSTEQPKARETDAKQKETQKEELALEPVYAMPIESTDPIVLNNTYLPPPTLGSAGTSMPKPTPVPGKLPVVLTAAPVKPAVQTPAPARYTPSFSGRVPIASLTTESPVTLSHPTEPSSVAIAEATVAPAAPMTVPTVASRDAAAVAVFQPGTDGMACFRCKARKRRCDRARPCAACCALGAEASCGTGRLDNYDAFVGAPKSRKKARVEEEEKERRGSVASSSHSTMTT